MTIQKRNINKEIIALFSGQSSTITTPRLYVELTGSYSLAVILNQVVFWSNKSKLMDGWFYKSYADWLEELGIPERTLRRYLSKLQKKEWLETKIKKVDDLNTLHIKPDIDKIIESISNKLNQECPNRPLCPDGSNNELKNCTKVAPTGHFGRSEPANLADSSIYTEENKQIINTPSGVDNFKNLFLSLENLTADNPHAIEESQLAEWLLIRKKKKSPLTQTAWNRTNKVLFRLIAAGLNAQDCFERMVASGWQGMEYKYFEQELRQPTNKYPTADERAANEVKIREREFKAQEEKQREIEGSHKAKHVLDALKSSMTFLEAKKKADEDMKLLGMNPKQYHNHLLKQSNTMLNYSAV